MGDKTYHLVTVQTGFEPRRALFPPRENFSRTWSVVVLVLVVQLELLLLFSVGECEQWGTRPFQLATVETGLGTQRAKLKSFTELAIIVLAVGNDFIL